MSLWQTYKSISGGRGIEGIFPYKIAGLFH